MSGIHDAGFNFVQPMATLKVVAVACGAGSFTPVTIPPTPVGPDRYTLQIEPVSEAYELRFNSTDPAGITILANTQYIHPDPIARSVTPEIKKANAAMVHVLIGFPASP